MRKSRDPMSLRLSPEMQKELRLDSDAYLEEMLVQSTVLCWLRLSYVEHAYTSITSGEGTFTKMKYWEGRLNAAQRRFYRAAETLSRNGVNRHGTGW